MPGSVLHVGMDDALLASRTALIESAGYRVVRCETTEAAIRSLQEDRFDVVVLCHSVPPDERPMIRAAVQAFRPGTPILYVSKYGQSSVVEPLPQGVSVVDNQPHEILNGIRTAVVARA